MIPLMIQELKKYQIIIQMAKHMSSRKSQGHDVSYLIPSMDRLIKGCQLTDPTIGGTNLIPLSGSVSLFSQNLADSLYAAEIQKADGYFNTQLAACIKGASGQHTKTFGNFNERALAKAILGSTSATYGVDYVFVGLDVHLYNVNPGIFDQLKNILASFP